MPARNRILAVDDNPTNLLVLAEALEPHYDFRAASDGETAMQIAYHFRPDVILLDVMMPRVDGYHICRRMKGDPQLRHSRIIMVSAKRELDDRLRGYDSGADDYLTKPFDEEELRAKVRIALKSRTSDEFESLQRQLEHQCGATGELLALVSQLRDQESGDHLVRIRAISQILAGELRRGVCSDRIDDQFLDDLYFASVLHDVGKIGLSDRILGEPQSLTPEEAERLQEHTLIGERIMKCFAQRHPTVELFRMAAAVARSHHECFDGSGYPDGLRGLAIPLAARIVKFADEFDRLVTGEAGVAPNDCLRNDILRRKAIDFDSAIVDAALVVDDELIDLFENEDVKEVLELTT